MCGVCYEGRMVSISPATATAHPASKTPDIKKLTARVPLEQLKHPKGTHALAHLPQNIGEPRAKHSPEMLILFHKEVLQVPDFVFVEGQHHSLVQEKRVEIGPLPGGLPRLDVGIVLLA